MRKAFPRFILNNLKKDKRIFVLLGDIGVHGFKDVFKKYKNNILNFGVLEQTMISFAAGLSLEKKIPFVHTIAPFMVNRALEQIKIDLCYQNLNVNIISTGASLDYAALGSTHHCPDDIAILNSLPNMKIYIPGSENEFLDLLKNYKKKGPKYFRMSSKLHNLNLKISNSACKIRKGEKALVIVIGSALRFIQDSIDKIDANIIYLNCVKPLNEEIIKKNFHSNIILIQDFYNCSISADISNLFNKKKIRLLEIGLPKIFFNNYGLSENHYKKYGLNEIQVLDRIKRFLK